MTAEKNSEDFPVKILEALKKIQFEPNYYEFRYLDYDCFILRMLSPYVLTGQLNGYVVIPKGHPLYETDYGHLNIECHGGLTYSGLTEHLAAQTRFKDSWCFGFDTAHAWDLQPLYYLINRFRYPNERVFTHVDPEAEYRDLEYVKNECRKIVDQIKAKFG